MSGFVACDAGGGCVGFRQDTNMTCWIEEL